MAMIDDFVLYDDGKKSDIFITLRNTTITFSKAVIESLGYAEFVHMYTNAAKGQVAFKACGQDDCAIRFFSQPKDGAQILVRVSGKKRISVLMDMAGVSDCGKGMRFYGRFIKDEGLVVFDLK